MFAELQGWSVLSADAGVLLIIIYSLRACYLRAAVPPSDSPRGPGL